MAFTNQNVCQTQKLTLATGSYAALAANECSEVILVSTDLFYVKSSNDTGGTTVEMLVPANTFFTVRGITNTNQVSVKGNSTSVCYARAQYYTSLTPIAG